LLIFFFFYYFKNNSVPSTTVIDAGNEAFFIRRQKSNQELIKVYLDNTINAERPTKIIIEVTNDGHVRLYTEANKQYPAVAVFDEKPLHVNYISFAAYQVKNDFFYNCRF